MDPDCEVAVRSSHRDDQTLPRNCRSLLLSWLFLFLTVLSHQRLSTDILAEDHDSALVLLVLQIQHFTATEIAFLDIGIAFVVMVVVDVGNPGQSEHVCLRDDFVRSFVLVEDLLSVNRTRFVFAEVAHRVPVKGASEGQTELNRELVRGFLKVQKVFDLASLLSVIGAAAVERLPKIESWNSVQGDNRSAHLEVQAVADSFLPTLNRHRLPHQLKCAELRVVVSDNHFSRIGQYQITMMTTDTDISYTNLCQLSSAHLNYRLCIKIDHMNRL